MISLEMLPETQDSLPIDDRDEGLLTAGTRVPAGDYRRVDVAGGRVVRFESEDVLPASCDGHVALYERIVRFICQRTPALGAGVR